MNQTQIERFERLKPQLKSLYSEMQLLSNKKPNEVVNKFKIQVINNFLTEANDILGKEFKPIAEFDVFDVETMPFNSDVVLVLAQYLQALELLHDENVAYSETDFRWYWITENKKAKIETYESR